MLWGQLQRLNIDVATSVADAVKLYRAAEYLTGDNQYMCPSCQRKVDAERRVVITSLPNVLNIQVCTPRAFEEMACNTPRCPPTRTRTRTHACVDV